MIDLRRGDALGVLRTLESGSAHCVVTSPPYWGLRDYGVAGQLGMERTPAEFVERLTAVFREARRVLRDDGTLWLNLGDSYVNNPGNGRGGERRRLTGADPHRSGRSKAGCGLPAKNLAGIPWRVALALQDDGWILRSEVIWEKTDAMPDGAKDRPTRSHESVFLLSKSARYRYDRLAIREPSLASEESRLWRNARTVWRLPTGKCKGAHFATMPPELCRRAILAGSRPGDVVLDPFAGLGTVGAVASKLGRCFVGIDLNPAYLRLARERIAAAAPAVAV